MLEDRACYIKHCTEQTQLYGCQPGAGSHPGSLENGKKSSGLYAPICIDIFLHPHLQVRSKSLLGFEILLIFPSGLIYLKILALVSHDGGKTQVPLLYSEVLCFNREL